MTTIGELAEKAIELNKRDFTVFFDISGHVKKVQIRWCFGGWDSNQTFAKEKAGTYEFYDETPAEIEKAMAALLRANEENDTRKADRLIAIEKAEKVKLKELQEKYGATK